MEKFVPLTIKCPLCGSKDIIVTPYRRDKYRVTCRNCRSEGKVHR